MNNRGLAENVYEVFVCVLRMRAVQSCGGDVIAAAGVAARGRAGGESGGRRAAARHAA